MNHRELLSRAAVTQAARQNSVHRSVTAVATMATCAALASVLPVPAYAQTAVSAVSEAPFGGNHARIFVTGDVVTGPVADLDVTLIDPYHMADLIVRKSQPNPFDENPTGVLPYEPRDGVRIRVSRVAGVTLNTVEGWRQATRMTLSQARQSLEEPLERVTDSNGAAVFENLTVGLYMVEEMPRTDGKYQVVETRPILLTVPSGGNTDAAGKSPERLWAYHLDVTLKPKGKPLPDPEVIPSPLPPKPAPAEPDTEGARQGNLAITGADLVGFFGAGMMLGATGICFLITGRRKEDKEA